MSQAANTLWVNRYSSSARAAAVERRRGLYRRFIDGLIITVILAASAICVSVYFRARAELAAATVKREAAEGRLNELKVQAERRESQVRQLKNDTRTIELYARQKLGFVRDGDIVIKLPQEQAMATTSARAGILGEGVSEAK